MMLSWWEFVTRHGTVGFKWPCWGLKPGSSGPDFLTLLLDGATSSMLGGNSWFITYLWGSIKNHTKHVRYIANGTGILCPLLVVIIFAINLRKDKCWCRVSFYSKRLVSKTGFMHICDFEDGSKHLKDHRCFLLKTRDINPGVHCSLYTGFSHEYRGWNGWFSNFNLWKAFP